MLLLEEESIPLCWLLERDDELEAGRGGGGVLAAPDSRVSSTSWDGGPSIVASSSMTCPQDGQADSPPVSAVEQAGQRGTRHCTRAWASLWPTPLGFGLWAVVLGLRHQPEHVPGAHPWNRGTCEPNLSNPGTRTCRTDRTLEPIEP